MKKNIGKYIGILLGTICIILVITLICIKVSSVDAKTGEKNLKSKIEEEIKYLDENIIDIMNKLNNIDVIKYKVYTKEVNDPSSQGTSQSGSNQGSSSEQGESGGQSSEGESSSSGEQSGGGGSSSEQTGGNEGGASSGQTGGEGSNSSSGQESSGSSSSSSGGSSNSEKTTVSSLVPNATLEQNVDDIDWKEISFLFENIYSTIPTINLDLQKQGITSDLISNFSVSMDGAIQAIKNKDKSNTLINLFNMYINLPKYIESINGGSFKLNIINTKANILNAYVLASAGNKWDKILTSVQNAKGYFSSIISSNESDENRKMQLQKTYILIEDLERMTKINDKNIFYIGYKNVMQDLQTL